MFNIVAFVNVLTRLQVESLAITTLEAVSFNMNSIRSSGKFSSRGT